jgi:2-polyprenyl-6-methoxyphenol hydroxylase-like FAD-dependent oxidoreductase
MPIGQGRVCWYATRNGPATRPDGTEGRKREIQGLFGGWHRPIQELIEATEPELIMKNDARDRKPLRKWGVGSVTLLGDAAHPITPNVGQGACMAIEDAACLAKSLQSEPDLARAFLAYEEARTRRTAFVGLRSRHIGTIGQLENRVLTQARDAIAQFVLRVSGDIALSTVYAYEV